MCGIFALLNSQDISSDLIQTEFIKGCNRGPEFSKLDTSYTKLSLGFHRLAINGLNNESNQPLVFNDIVLICNGEIYNYKQLYKCMNVTPQTDSDCEVIIHLYIAYGIEQTLIMLDGVFAFVLYDNRNPDKTAYVARDPFGVRPLYFLKNKTANATANTVSQNEDAMMNLYGFASELKCLEYFYNTNVDNFIIGQFQPGTYSIFNLQNNIHSSWQPSLENIIYFIPTFSHTWCADEIPQCELKDNMHSQIADYLKLAVNKRCLTTERPIACLLSGGLDSSLIAALVNNFYKENNISNKLETYCIGLKGSEDLKYARIIADYLETNHTEIIVTEKQMFDAIPEVIYATESYDTTTIRASIGNYLIGKYIKQHSKAKVIFNGDGSDELFGGYLYMSKCPDDIEFDKETRRLLRDIHLFDVLRSDKSISSHGLEPRTPFLDKTFVNFILSIPAYFRTGKNISNVEKYLLRRSFSFEHFKDFKCRQILPDAILWRKKEAFSDGVSSQERSLFQILQEQITEYILQKESKCVVACIETEKEYYKTLFNRFYPNCAHTVPYLWMPKYSNANDPSARTLGFYSKN